LIFDTDILIWRLRRHPRAVELAGQVPFPERNISAVSYLELLFGCRDGAELRLLKNSLAEYFSEVIPVSEVISRSAILLMERYALARRPGVTDILIAATAMAK
jgi:predicted nucleic acid-binding protein